MTKQLAVFTTVLLGLAGANAVQIWGFLYAFFFGQTLPDTTFFITVFWFWILTVLGITWCAFSGGYSLLRGGSVHDERISFFVFASCVVFKVGTSEFGYTMIRVAVNLGTEQFHVGLNLLGLLFIWWLVTLRRQFPSVEARAAESQLARGRGAI